MNKNLLKGKIVSKGKNIETICEELEISKSAMYRKLNGSSYFNAKEIKKMIKCLELSNEEMNLIFFNQ
ncbi:helix-turn-helix domain-containing protein [Fusobacterium varium]|jgi:hypothetical protein|uniref:helix-turn-helix domain-containing protein n=1 Tax=Fusobacterium varium TaxID=856 RepID=UPI00204CF43C|nr:helix-turn-helix domain-containing protein [Fusobacterium varium]DAE89483.1 MAG TPA: LAMBDA REPRESSOR (TRIPLE MUTANT)/DNA COMPLEX-DNA COMPLEX, DOUBLE HELIX, TRANSCRIPTION-DNA.1A [Caudoviricetes sp.]